VRDRASDWIEDDPDHLTAEAVGAVRVGSDRELCFGCHCCFRFPLAAAASLPP